MCQFFGSPICIWKDFAGLTYCTSFNDISAENTETLPANMRCLVHDSNCEAREMHGNGIKSRPVSRFLGGSKSSTPLAFLLNNVLLSFFLWFLIPFLGCLPTLSTLKRLVCFDFPTKISRQGSSEGKCSPACPRYTTNGCECAKSWVQEGYEEPWLQRKGETMGWAGFEWGCSRGVTGES